MSAVSTNRYASLPDLIDLFVLDTHFSDRGQPAVSNTWFSGLLLPLLVSIFQRQSFSAYYSSARRRSVSYNLCLSLSCFLLKVKCFLGNYHLFLLSLAIAHKDMANMPRNEPVKMPSINIIFNPSLAQHYFQVLSAILLP